MAVGGRVERVPADEHRLRLLALPEPLQEAREADERVEADRLRQRVVGAVGERVAVDREQEAAHSDASSAWIAAISRSVAVRAASASSWPAQVVELDRLAVAHAPRLEPAQAVRALDPRRDERHPGLERDPRRPGVRARLARLPQALPAPRALGEHRDHVARARQPDGGLDRRVVGLAAVHLERAGAGRDRREREPEELRLRHEAQKTARPDRQPDRPGIEIREVAGRQHVARSRRADARFRRPDSGRRAAAPARKQGRCRSRAAWAGEDASPAASIADLAHGAMVAREMAGSNGKKLVIVESPAKAKTIAGYLGNGLHGRVVDRPHPRPAAQRRGDPGRAQGRDLGAPRRQRRQRLRAALRRRLAKKKVVSDLKAKLKNADELLLATDEDREGEAIAWHLARC